MAREAAEREREETAAQVARQVEIDRAEREAELAALEAELKTLKAGALQKRAAAAGMGEDALEAALDSDDQAGRLIEFILANEKVRDSDWNLGGFVGYFARFGRI